MSGRRALLIGLCVSLLAMTGTVAASERKRLIVLGVDGMDPVLLRAFMDSGIMPNFSKLAARGGFMPLGTSTPPQSPVAWSNFITGMDPGGHGLFDFIALDRDTLLPYLSSARVEKPAREPLAIGPWRVPLASERTVLLRDGTAFWELLEEAGVETTMFRIPANYPPVRTDSGRAIAGMGTPDLRGSPGTFSYYTDAPMAKAGKVAGGVIERVAVKRGTVRAVLGGPPNPFLEGAPAATVEFEVHVDASNPVALIRIGDERVLLNVGEWSDWIEVRFELVPGLVNVPGMVRLFLRQTSPDFGLYISPVNIDPRDPAQPIATPAQYAFELAEAVGPFYTQEMPEDTKALSAQVLSPRDFLVQSGLVLNERRALLQHELRRFRQQRSRALLFFYFSSVDQRHHMLARHLDREHPFHREDTPTDLTQAMRTTYQEMDEILGWVLEELDQDTGLIVMSDHGFAPFRRQAHLNTWLERQGYLSLKASARARREKFDWLSGIDWSRTRAFAIGLNSLYLNVRGRERYGIVEPDRRRELAREIADALHGWQDPMTGKPVVTRAVTREEAYHGPHLERAPDLVVGYGPGYRASWATTMGKVPAGLIEDNLEEWSGDHCMDPRAVPGVLLSDRPLQASEADLRDLSVSILSYFEVSAPPQMTGRSVF